ncbi:DNA topoisomerase 3, partial [Desulfobacterales bacterium HSG2]|nr:DNA topoisomerase 3 [Desulfobacterales bacterium HSG2]
MKTLILTEKPSVARDFAKALNIRGNRDGYIEDDNYIITWAIGHLVELLEPEDYDEKWKKWHLNTLPIIPEQFRYKSVGRTEKQLDVIQRLLKKAQIDEIVIATDAGREGEVIARTILLYSGFKDNKKVKRFWTSQALTPQVVRDGMKELKPASSYDRLWRAGQSRQIADWLVGMNASRAATIKMNDLFSIGRVQTAVLSLLVDRRRERENFKPEPYWILRACFSNEKGNWWGSWFRNNQTRFSIEKDAVQVQEKITEQTGTVLSVKKQKKKQPPPFLYSLTDLQQEANKKFGFSAKQTLNIAQELYENKKCLSYPRTDSKVLGTKNVDMAQALVEKLSRSYEKYFAGVEEKLIRKSNKRVFNDSKLTDHHALIPLAPLPGNANYEEQKIYMLVLKRFAAAFHPDCEYEQTDIVTQVQDERFRTKGKRILKPGWQAVYENETEQKASGDSESEPEFLPAITKGDPADVRDTKLEKKKTTPPPEYTEALLLKDMTNPGRYVSEDELKKIYRGDVGLGTQATRAQIIETLLSRRYTERKKKHLIATNKGCHLVDTLRRFKVANILASPQETARWEMQLNQIAHGKGSEKEFLNEIK